MKNNQQGIRKIPALFEESRLIKAILVMVAMFTISPAVHAQASQNQQPITPVADHHMHIWSVNASAQVTDPVMPAIKLPDDFDPVDHDGH